CKTLDMQSLARREFLAAAGKNPLVTTLSYVIDDLLSAIGNVGDRVRSVRHTGGGDRGLGREQRYQFQSLRLFGPVVQAAENEMDINIGKILCRTGSIEAVVDKRLFVHRV